MDEWVDDPCFDAMEEVVDGRLFRGDDWRRVTRIRERAAVRIVAVAGTSFRAAAVAAAMRGRGARVALVPEPANPHDREAVAVHVNGEHVGYVPRATRVAPGARVHLCKWGVAPAPHVWLAVEGAPRPRPTA